LAFCGLATVLGSTPAAQAAQVDVTVRSVEMIQPGTVIGNQAPRGWTHLVIKSRPRMEREMARKVADSTAELASLLFTAIVADVRADPHAQDEARFCLARVGVGVGTRLSGRDVILSSETQQQLGADLGILEQMVLSGGEKELKKMRCTARSRTLAILDARGVLAVEGRHYPVVLRYALLVNPRTGRLDTLLWVLHFKGEQQQYGGPLTHIQWLPPNLVDDCLLHVDTNEFIFGFPTSLAFAMARPPQGWRVIAFPNELRGAAVQARFAPAVAQNLQWELHKLVSAQALSWRARGEAQPPRGSSSQPTSQSYEQPLAGPGSAVHYRSERAP
jgi:hypothetical protein